MGPYSMDLRERVAAAIDEGEGSETSNRQAISRQCLRSSPDSSRGVDDAGTLAPKPHGGGPRPVLGFPEQVRLAMLIAVSRCNLEPIEGAGGFA